MRLNWLNDENDRLASKLGDAAREIAALRLRLAETTHERDNWKQCEGDCARQYDNLSKQHSVTKGLLTRTRNDRDRASADLNELRTETTARLEAIAAARTRTEMREIAEAGL